MRKRCQKRRLTPSPRKSPFDEIGIAGDGVKRPDADSVAFGVVPAEERAEAIGVEARVGDDLRARDIGAVIARLDFLIVIGVALPEEFAGLCVVDDGADVGLAGDEFEFSVAVEIDEARRIDVVVIVGEFGVVVPDFLAGGIEHDVGDIDFINAVAIDVDGIDVVAVVVLEAGVRVRPEEVEAGAVGVEGDEAAGIGVDEERIGIAGMELGDCGAEVVVNVRHGLGGPGDLIFDLAGGSIRHRQPFFSINEAVGDHFRFAILIKNPRRCQGLRIASRLARCHPAGRRSARVPCRSCRRRSMSSSW